MQQSQKGTPDEKIVNKAKVWRQRDRVAIADKADRQKQSDQFRALQQLRDTIDQAGGQP